MASAVKTTISSGVISTAPTVWRAIAWNTLALMPAKSGELTRGHGAVQQPGGHGGRAVDLDPVLGGAGQQLMVVENLIPIVQQTR